MKEKHRRDWKEVSSAPSSIGGAYIENQTQGVKIQRESRKIPKLQGGESFQLSVTRTRRQGGLEQKKREYFIRTMSRAY